MQRETTAQTEKTSECSGSLYHKNDEIGMSDEMQSVIMKSRV